MHSKDESFVILNSVHNGNVILMLLSTNILVDYHLVGNHAFIPEKERRKGKQKRRNLW